MSHIKSKDSILIYYEIILKGGSGSSEIWGERPSFKNRGQKKPGTNKTFEGAYMIKRVRGIRIIRSLV